MKPKTAAEARLREHGLRLPGAYEEFPWGHRALKVNKKVFAFLPGESDTFSISVKLVETNAIALELPFAVPTGYGLGKSGWVSASFPDVKEIPVDLLCEWLDESYRAVAPKKLVAQMGGDRPTEKPAPKASKAKPKASKAKPKASKAKPKASKAKPKASKAKPKASKAKPKPKAKPKRK